VRGPDGPIEREAEHREHFDSLPDNPADHDYDQDLPSDLMDIAQAKMMNWAMDRVFQ
jgi:hypothetical protein